MVKPVAKAEISSFVKGIISEASPLNFPADASRDEENYELNKDGSRDRRLGIDFEDDYTLLDTGYLAANIKDVNISSYKWFNAGNNADNEFAVVQIGDTIHIFDSAKSSVSGTGFLDAITLTGVDATKRFSFASIDGMLVIAAGTDTIHVVTYDNSVFNYTTGRILTRDLWGIPGNDNNEISTRPSVRTDSLIYNLQNQGWGIPRKDSGGTLSDPIQLFFNAYSKYPSNLEVVYTGLQFQPVSGGTPFERIYTNLYDDQLGLDAKAAKGYFIIDALKRGTSRLDEFNANKSKFPSLAQTLTSLPADTTSGGSSLIADFAGRVFFGGFEGEVVDGDANSPVLSSYIFFSQLVKSRNDIFKCYQNGDPTSREVSDLLDTDGGFIRISGAKKLYGLVALSNNLFILADNGVWMVLGGSDYGFSATNYAVNKISSFGCNSKDSIVVVNDRILFWGSEGIFQVSKNQYGDWTCNNISEGTIQSIYDSIEDTDKSTVKGIYDQFDKKIRWLYNQDSDTTNSNTVREIVLDVSLGSFSKTRIYNLVTNSPDVVGFIQTASFLSGMEDVAVVVGADSVLVDGEQVVISRNTRTSGLQSIKYIVLHGSVGGNVGFSFAQYKDDSFHDWKSVDGIGVDAKGFILTGTITASDSAVAKQTPYLTMHFRRTENGVLLEDGSLVPAHQSGCLIRSQWNWANSANSGKWSPQFQAYRYRTPYFITSIDDEYDNGFEVVTSKNKLRGRGKALSLYIETEENKDCRILGWNLALTGNNLA